MSEDEGREFMAEFLSQDPDAERLVEPGDVALSAMGIDEPEVLDFDVAEAIGFISGATRADLEAALPNHAEIFESVLEANSDLEVADRYRKAFSLYRRFVIKHEGDLDVGGISPDLAAILPRVAKDVPDAEALSKGLEGRSPLQFVLYKLKAMRADVDANTHVTDKKDELEIQRQEDADSRRSANANLRVVDPALEFINEASDLSELEESLKTLRKSDAKAVKLTEKAAEAKTKDDEAITALAETNDFLVGLSDGFQPIFHGLTTVAARLLTYNAEEKLLTPIGALIQQISDFSDLLQAQPLDQDAVIDAYKSLAKASRKQLKAMMTPSFGMAIFKNKAMSVGDNTTDTGAEIRELHKVFTDLDDEFAPKFKDRVAALKASNKAEGKRADLDEKRDEAIATFESNREEVLNTIANDGQSVIDRVRQNNVGASVPGVAADIPDFTASFLNFIQSDNLSSEDIEGFVDDNYVPMLGTLQSRIESKKEELDTEVVRATEAIDSNNILIERSEDVLEQDTFDASLVVQKAFEDISIGPDGKAYIRGYAGDQKRNVKAIDTAVAYLDDADAFRVLNDKRTTYVDLKSKVTPTIIRATLDAAGGDDAAAIDENADLATVAGSVKALIDSLGSDKKPKEVPKAPDSLLVDADGKPMAPSTPPPAPKVVGPAELGRLNALLTSLTNIDTAKKALREDTAKLVDRLRIASNLRGRDGNIVDPVAGLVQAFESGALDDEARFPAFSHDLEALTTNSARAEALRTGLVQAKTAIEDNTNMSDSKIAKRLLEAMHSITNPDLPEEDNKKLSQLMLVEGVQDLQRDQDYEGLAARASARLLDVDDDITLHDHLLTFQFKQGGKPYIGFPDVDPEDFSNEARINSLFEQEKLDLKSASVACAYFHHVSEEEEEPLSRQALYLEDKVKLLIAEQLGVEERMDEPEVASVVNNAYEAQMKVLKPIVESHIENVEENLEDWSNDSVEGLNKMYEALRLDLRSKTINQAKFDRKLNKLRETARERFVADDVDFAETSALARFADSPNARAVAAFFANKVGRDGLAVIKAKGIPTLEKTYMLGSGLVKLSFWAVTRPFALIGRAFSSKPSARKSILSSVAKDLRRVVTKSKHSKKLKFEEKDYDGESSKEAKALRKDAKELMKDGEFEPIKVGRSPFIDLKKYKTDIKKINDKK